MNAEAEIASEAQVFSTRPLPDGDGLDSGEKTTERQKYPRVVILVVLSNFLNCFSSYGVRALVYIYLTNFIKFDSDTATAVFHAFSAAISFMPVVALLIDGWFGLFRTIVCMSVVYNLGHLALALTSFKPLGAPTVTGAVVSILFISLGGAIEHGLNSFSGSQFDSYQKQYLERFYSVIYIFMHLGCFLGSAILPILRKDVKCYGDDCYPLVFSLASLVILGSFTLFLLGSPFYRKEKAAKIHGHNIVIDMAKCMCNGFGNRVKKMFVTVADDEKSRPVEHWIDHADCKYSQQLKDDIKGFCKVMFVFLPLPLFWATYDQQESRWSAQAQQLDGRIGSWYIIKPDQIKAVNPIACIVLGSILDFFVYPLMRKKQILAKYLQRMSLGLVFGIVSFMFAAFLQWQMQKATAHRNPDQQIKLVNLLPCQLELVASDDNSTVILTIPPPSLYNNHAYRLPQALTKQLLSQPGSNSSETATLFKLNAQCWHAQTGENYSLNALDVRIPTGFALNTLIFYSSDLVNSPSSSSSGRVQTIGTYSLPFSISNRPIGRTEIRFLKFHIPTHLSPIVSNEVVTYSPTQLVQVGLMPDSPTLTNHLYSTVDYSNYRLTIKASNGNELLKGHQIQLLNCARYSIVLFTNSMTSSNTSSLDFVTLTDIHPNGISLGWQAIQISIMAVAEILFTVSSMVFVYSQAPASMKSLVHVCFACAVGLGQVLVVFVVKLRFFKDQVHEYLLFAFMLAASALAFILLSIRYEYIQSSNEEPTADEQRRRNSNAEINTTYPHRSSLRRMSVVSPRPSWIPIEKTEMTPITSLS